MHMLARTACTLPMHTAYAHCLCTLRAHWWCAECACAACSCGVLVQVHTPLLVQLVARLGRGEACAGAEDCLRAARELRWLEAVLRATRGLKSFSEYDRATHPWPRLIPALTQPWPSP